MERKGRIMYSFQLSERKTDLIEEELEDDEFDYFAPEYTDEESYDDEDNEREYCD